MKKICTFFDQVDVDEKGLSYALLAARVSLAMIFITHGYGKLFAEPGLEMFTGMLDGLGFPLAGLMAFLVAVAEFFGGIAILLGVLTRFSAFWLGVISLVAWVVVKGWSFGFQAEGNLDVLALGLSIVLFFAGPGALSVSAKMKKNPAQV